jgi:hypothetical protein
MARPLYLICSESGAVDKSTNTVSAFNIIEAIQLFEHPPENPGVPVERAEDDPPSVPQPILPLRIVVTWICDDNEMGQEFEHETRWRRSSSPEWKILHQGKFAWRTRNQRFTVQIGGMQIHPETRLLLIESAIRPVGGDDNSWIRQKYEIVVELGSPATVQ